MSGGVPDFFAALARKAVQTPSLQPRRASRFEEAATPGPTAGADTAAFGDAEPQLASAATDPVHSSLETTAASRPTSFRVDKRLNEQPKQAHAADPQAELALQRPALPPTAPLASLAAVERLDPHAQPAALRAARARDAGEPGLDMHPKLARLDATPLVHFESVAPHSPQPMQRRPAAEAGKEHRLAAQAEVGEALEATRPHHAVRALDAVKLQALDAAAMPRQPAGSDAVERGGRAAAAAAAPEAPRIEIHIGRIELLPAGAPLAAAAPERPAAQGPQSVQSAQSLASYLAERGRR